MPPPFAIFALPRCRTVWLSRFLTYAGWQCGHDQLRHCRSLEDVRAWLSLPCTGTIETSAAPFWRLLPDDVTVAVIRRPLGEVTASLRRGGLDFDNAVMLRHLWMQDRKLGQIERRRPNVLATTFAELGTEAGCRRLFEHCLPYSHDSNWWKLLAPLNMQISLPHMMHYFAAHRAQLDTLAETAKHQCIAAMRPMPRAYDGMEIGQESFETWYRDGAALFADHCVAVGEAPSAWRLKNEPFVRALDAIGALQITTARSNGRLFGYLMTIIGPSLEAQNRLVATNTTFYASPDVRGLGMQLQRASLDALRARGVQEVFWATRGRGAGERIGALYRRLGAAHHGEWFRLAFEGGD